MKSKETESKYPVEAILKSKALSGYQPDFAKAILTEPAYTVEEAVAAIDKALKKLMDDGTVEKIFADFGEAYSKPE